MPLLRLDKHTRPADHPSPQIVCNFECAVVLSKYLLAVAHIDQNSPPPTADERMLLETLQRMLEETEFAIPIDTGLPAGSSSAGGPAMGFIGPTSNMRIRRLAAAVVRLWAETFKGNHIFDIVSVMCSTLDGYADLIEKPRDRTPLVRIPPQPGM